ncbi:hypothetical protein AB0L06_19455 [Spirillospora sp. NPDC052269]
MVRLKGLRYLEVTRERWRELSKLDDLPPLAIVGVHPDRPDRSSSLWTTWDTVYGRPPTE